MISDFNPPITLSVLTLFGLSIVNSSNPSMGRVGLSPFSLLRAQSEGVPIRRAGVSDRILERAPGIHIPPRRSGIQPGVTTRVKTQHERERTVFTDRLLRGRVSATAGITARFDAPHSCGVAGYPRSRSTGLACFPPIFNVPISIGF